MRKSILVSLSILGLLTTHHAAVGNSEPEVSLSLKIRPHLCLRYAKQDQCRIDVIIDWNSNQSANYCLHSSQDAAPLQCWDSSRKGKRSELRIINSDLTYWLSFKGQQSRLTERVLNIATLVNDERRAQRQRRHIWSLI